MTASALGWVTSWVIGRDVLARVVGQIRKQQRIDGERAADADADGGAVGRGLGDGVGGEIAAGARLVLDQECAGGIFLWSGRRRRGAPRCRASNPGRTGPRMRTVLAGHSCARPGMPAAHEQRERQGDAFEQG